MAGDTTLILVGNLTAAPELRFTQSGAAVVSFTVASTPRSYDKNTDRWVDGDALFMRCTAWRQLAENVTESLDRGDRVMVTGRLVQRSFETKDGDKRTVMELQVEEVGPSLKWATAKVSRVGREGGQQEQRPQQARRDGPARQAPADDPWGSAPASGYARQSSGGFADEPPF
jgi:single-strand DNA-binding protein